jgi:hypothetical protein
MSFISGAKKKPPVHSLKTQSSRYRSPQSQNGWTPIDFLTKTISPLSLLLVSAASLVLAWPIAMNPCGVFPFFAALSTFVRLVFLLLICRAWVGGLLCFSWEVFQSFWAGQQSLCVSALSPRSHHVDPVLVAFFAA